MKECPTCKDRTGHTPMGEAQCRLRSEAVADLDRYARTLDKPPTSPKVADIFAHLRNIYGDSTEAHRAARVVLDLGWRPSFEESP